MSHWKRWTFVGLLATLSLSGCMPVIGWVVNAFAPPRKVPPLYDPPKDKKMLVFVDDILNPVAYEPIKRDLSRLLNERLAERKVVQELVSYDRLIDLMAAEPAFNDLAVSEIGGRLGADTVLYVHIDEFELQDQAAQLWQGRLATTVRVIDVEKGRLWPDDREAGYPVDPVETPQESHPAEDYGRILSAKMANDMADRIAKMFYQHEVPAHEAVRQEQLERFEQP